MISRFNSKTDMPVPSKATLEGSFCDLKRKNTEEDMMLVVIVHRTRAGLLKGYHRSEGNNLELVCRKFKSRREYLD